MGSGAASTTRHATERQAIRPAGAMHNRARFGVPVGMAPSQQGLRRSVARNFDVTLRDRTLSKGGPHTPVDLRPTEVGVERANDCADGPIWPIWTRFGDERAPSRAATRSVQEGGDEADR
jgi:hypothetical protein